MPMRYEKLHPSRWFDEEESRHKETIPTEENVEKSREEREKELVHSITLFLESGKNKLGEGGTAYVYYPETNQKLCFKVIRNVEVFARPEKLDAVPSEYQRFASEEYKDKLRERPWHVTLAAEGDFLDSAREIKDVVRVPEPYMVMELESSEETDDFFISDKVKVLVMERLPAISVEDIIQKKIKLPEGFSVDRFSQRLRSFIDKMHERGLFHRDMAARNVMVDMQTGDPYVIDFGRSKFGHEEPYRDDETKLFFPRTDEDGVDSIEKDLKLYSQYSRAIDNK